MVAKNTPKMEKVSFTLPSDLKEKAMELKKDLQVSLNTIYRNALEQYIEQQEIKKWEKAAEMAAKDKDYMRFCKEWSEVGLEVEDYDQAR